MHVLVLYNQPTLEPGQPDAEAEQEIVETAHAVAKALERSGERVTRLGIRSDPAPLMQVLRDDRPDVTFNLFEGTAHHPEAESHVAGLLEWLGIPYTGSPSRSLLLARDKSRAKPLLEGARLPTPRFTVVHRLPVPENTLGWPVIVKPATEDASVGIDQGSVVTSQVQLVRRAEQLLHRYRPPVLVEEFIAGREFNVSIVENPDLQILPIAEIVFTDLTPQPPSPAPRGEQGGRGPGRWPIVTYQAKWSPGSAEDLATRPCCPADVPAALAERLGALAARAFEVFGCRDYARVDFRVHAHGEPFILEVNPNPSFHPTAGLSNALKAAGLSHEEFSVALVRQAFARPA